MIRSYVFFILAAVCCLGLASAQEKRNFGDSDRVAIEQVYGRYLQAFFKKDYTTIREYVQPPFVVYTGGEMRILESLDAIMRFWSDLSLGGS